MITPIRGRKRKLYLVLSRFMVKPIRNDNPDKGTETLGKGFLREVAAEIRNDNPDKGTETIAVAIFTIK